MKAMARYYGIRVQDLDAQKGPSWIAAAMRKKGTMSVETAAELVGQISVPRPDLVGKKRPQGMPADDVLQKLSDTEGDWDKLKALNLRNDAGLQYMGNLFFAQMLVQHYVAPAPGVSIFVMPGAARSVAEDIVMSLPLKTISQQRRRHVIESLAGYLEKSEQPLRTDLGEKLIPRLTVLGLVRRLREQATSNAADQGGAEEHAEGLLSILESMEQAEGRRDKIRRK